MPVGVIFSLLLSGPRSFSGRPFPGPRRLGCGQLRGSARIGLRNTNPAPVPAQAGLSRGVQGAGVRLENLSARRRRWPPILSGKGGARLRRGPRASPHPAWTYIRVSPAVETHLRRRRRPARAQLGPPQTLARASPAAAASGRGGCPHSTNQERPPRARGQSSPRLARSGGLHGNIPEGSLRLAGSSRHPTPRRSGPSHPA